MPFFPRVKTCCICIPNLKTAAAIISVLALTTNPVLSWVMRQQTYSLRVSCLLSAASRVDVVDVNINNVITFGFGVSTDLGASCLTQDGCLTNLITKALGWLLLVADTAYLISSIVFLVKIYRNPKRVHAIAFIITALISIFLSLIYGIAYPAVCVMRGKGIPLCQIILTFFDVGLWCYFMIVVYAYSLEIPSQTTNGQLLPRSNP